MPGCSMRTLPYSTLHNDMLTMLVVPLVAFLCIFTRLLTCSCMTLACQCVIHQHNEVMDIRSKPTFVPSQTPSSICLLYCLLVCLLPCLFAFQFACFSCYLSCLLPHAMLALLVCLFALYLLHIIYASLSFHCLPAGSLSLSLHVHTWSEDAGS